MIHLVVHSFENVGQAFQKVLKENPTVAPDIAFHPAAQQRFDEQANLLSGRISTRPLPRNTAAKFTPDFSSSATVTPEGLVLHEVADWVSGNGFLAGTMDGNTKGLYGPDYIDLQRLAEKVQATGSLRDVVSVYSCVTRYSFGSSTMPLALSPAR